MCPRDCASFAVPLPFVFRGPTVPFRIQTMGKRHLLFHEYRRRGQVLLKIVDYFFFFFFSRPQLSFVLSSGVKFINTVQNYSLYRG